MELPAPELMKDLKSSFPSVYDTVVHLYQSDSIWLARWKKDQRELARTMRLPAVCTSALCLDERFGPDDCIRGRPEEERLGTQDLYKTLAGVPYTAPIWQMILHIVNHGTHHRGQVTGMLRQLGAVPRNLDLLAYYRANQ